MRVKAAQPTGGRRVALRPEAAFSAPDREEVSGGFLENQLTADGHSAAKCWDCRDRVALDGERLAEQKTSARLAEQKTSALATSVVLGLDDGQRAEASAAADRRALEGKLLAVLQRDLEVGQMATSVGRLFDQHGGPAARSWS